MDQKYVFGKNTQKTNFKLGIENWSYFWISLLAVPFRRRGAFTAASYSIFNKQER